MQVIYEDNHIIIVNKESGEIVQGDKTGDQPLSETVKQYIKTAHNKPGNVFLGVVHRLDLAPYTRRGDDLDRRVLFFDAPDLVHPAADR